MKKLTKAQIKKILILKDGGHIYGDNNFISNGVVSCPNIWEFPLPEGGRNVKDFFIRMRPKEDECVTLVLQKIYDREAYGSIIPVAQFTDGLDTILDYNINLLKILYQVKYPTSKEIPDDFGGETILSRPVQFISIFCDNLIMPLKPQG